MAQYGFGYIAAIPRPWCDRYVWAQPNTDTAAGLAKMSDKEIEIDYAETKFDSYSTAKMILR